MEQANDPSLKNIVSRKQIYNLLRRKEDIKTAQINNACKHRKRLNGPILDCPVDKAVWRWFECAQMANIPVSGSFITEKAKHYAALLQKQSTLDSFLVTSEPNY